MAQPFFTIGHSTRAIGEFAGLLVPNGVTLLVDVRTVPRSRTNPQYNSDALPGSLAQSGIGYEHIASLGGLRGPPARGVPASERLLGEPQLPQLRRLRDGR